MRLMDKDMITGWRQGECAGMLEHRFMTLSILSELHIVKFLNYSRFVARYRWKKAIKAVRMLVKVKNQFSFPDEDEQPF